MKQLFVIKIIGLSSLDSGFIFRLVDAFSDILKWNVVGVLIRLDCLDQWAVEWIS